MSCKRGWGRALYLLSVLGMFPSYHHLILVPCICYSGRTNVDQLLLTKVHNLRSDSLFAYTVWNARETCDQKHLLHVCVFTQAPVIHNLAFPEVAFRLVLALP